MISKWHCGISDAYTIRRVVGVPEEAVMRWTAYQLRMPLYSTTVTWARPLRGGRYSFKWANLKMLGMSEGIYILWYPETEASPFQVVYVGQGIIQHRINHHRGNHSRILEKVVPRRLLLTWAVVPSLEDRNGIERYLSETLRPLVGEAWLAVFPLRVNLPGW